MAIGIQGDVDTGMAESFADYLGMDASFQHLGSVSVPRVMEPDTRDTTLPGNPGERMGDASRCQWSAIWMGEDQCILCKGKPKVRSQCLLVVMMRPQHQA